MTRNNYEWFKFEFRSWLESRRVQRMSLAAQALYIRALCLQATHGNVPSNAEDFAIEAKVRQSDVAAWSECLEHFSEEEIDGCKLLYNQKLREHLEATIEKKSKLANNGSKGGKSGKKSRQANGKANGKANGFPESEVKGQAIAKAKAPIRASYSNSLSLSKLLEDRFNNFWLVYPRKQQKQTALVSWKTHVPALELADQIITHVSDRAAKDHDWIKEDGKFVPFAATFLNQHRWEDHYSTAKPQNNAKSFKSQDDKVQEHHARVMKHDPLKTGSLTQEEIDKDAGMEILF